MFYDWRPYVPVAKRRQNAERELERLRKKGHPVSPVVIEGRAIASTFWGKAWCDNLEGYSDYSNRLPRGRTYVRNGSVVDLQVAAGGVSAVVSGSRLYKVAVKVAPVPVARWTSICGHCAGAIDSLVELLQGRFSKGVMERISQQQTGLFPMPTEIEFSCSCPDWASMCKHVAAVLYGIGARLDAQPELLFHLRQVDAKDLIAKAGANLPLAKQGPAPDKVLGTDGLSELFGLELDGGAALPEGAPTGRGKRAATSEGEQPTAPAARRRSPSKAPAKVSSKPTAKAPAQPPTKTPAKPSARSPAKSLGKPPAKASTTAPAKPPAKASTKAPAKTRGARGRPRAKAAKRRSAEAATR